MENDTVTLTREEWSRILLSLFWERNAKTGEPIPGNEELIRKITEQTGGVWGMAG